MSKRFAKRTMALLIVLTMVFALLPVGVMGAEVGGVEDSYAVEYVQEYEDSESNNDCPDYVSEEDDDYYPGYENDYAADDNELDEDDLADDNELECDYERECEADCEYECECQLITAELVHDPFSIPPYLLSPAFTPAWIADFPGWAQHRSNDTMLAYFMDAPLYERIIRTFNVGGAGIGNHPTRAQANAWTMPFTFNPDSWNGGTAGLHLGLTAAATRALGVSTLRGIEEFSSLTRIVIANGGANIIGEVPDLRDTSLQFLGLQNNNLTGTATDIINNLPSSLLALNIPTNQITGRVPTSWGNLEFVSFSGNRLVGSIPVNIGNTVNLHVLGLGNNQLIGGIPASIGNMSNLRELNLSVNFLSGSIPASLGNLTNLRTANLASNRLTGEIPASFVNLQGLQSFLANENNLTSGLNVIAQMTGLETVNLNNNRLVEAAPSFANLPNLQGLQFGANFGVTGGWPELHPGITTFGTMNIARNIQMAGSMPAAYANIDFSVINVVGTTELVGIGGVRIPPASVRVFQSYWYPLNYLGDFSFRYLDPTPAIAALNNGNMIMNHDIHGVGTGTLNIQLSRTANASPAGTFYAHPTSNVDVMGVGVANINILPTGFTHHIRFVQGQTIWRTNENGTTITNPREILGWVPTNWNVQPGARLDETTLMVNPGGHPVFGDVPFLVERPQFAGQIFRLNPNVLPPAVFGMGNVPALGQVINGVAYNIDLNGDGIPDLNIRGYPLRRSEAPIIIHPDYRVEFGLHVTTTPTNPTQNTDPTAPNFMPDLSNPNLIYNTDVPGHKSNDVVRNPDGSYTDSYGSIYLHNIPNPGDWTGPMKPCDDYDYALRCPGDGIYIPNPNWPGAGERPWLGPMTPTPDCPDGSLTCPDGDEYILNPDYPGEGERPWINRPSVTWRWGDVNSDGYVDFEDIELLEMYLAGFIGPNDLDLRAARVTGNVAVSFDDIELILMYIAGFISSLAPQ